MNNTQQVSFKKISLKGVNHFVSVLVCLTHWGRVTHICVGNLTIIGSDNGLSPGRPQAITWTIAGILFIGSLGTNFSEMLIEFHTFSFSKIHLKMSSGKWLPFCLGLNVLTRTRRNIPITKCKTAVSPLLPHWRFCSLALSHRHGAYHCFMT